MLNTNKLTITSPLFPGQKFYMDAPPEETKVAAQPKLKKDGTPKRIKCNKRKGKKSEVYPFQIPDIRKIMDYFIENKKWEHYLVFMISLNMARRIGDTLSLEWRHFYDISSGEFRTDLDDIVEDKTDKLANPHINSAVRNAINFYLENTDVNPADNDYNNPIFVQTSGNYKGRVLTADGYRKSLKKAAAEIGIKYNVGTHSTRKTFGMLSRMLHAGDYDSMELLQTIYNHSDTKTTKHYIGLTKQKVDKYFDDFGTFVDEYVVGGKTYEEVAETPIVSIDINDLRDVIKVAYKAGADNSGTNDPAVHIDAINNILSMIDGLKK